MSDTALVSLTLNSSLATKLVLLVLGLLSVGSWTIIFYKFWRYHLAEKADTRFLEAFRTGRDLMDLRTIARRCADGTLSALFQEGCRRLQLGGGGEPGDVASGEAPPPVHEVEIVLRGRASEAVLAYESYLPFLATTGNVAPFIGLFGTVLGIMNAFQAIGRHGTAGLAVVAPGVAEALIATAAGLFCAIPAVVAYNYGVNRVRHLVTRIEVFLQEFHGVAGAWAQGERVGR